MKIFGKRALRQMRYWLSEYSFDPSIDYKKFSAIDLVLLGMVKDGRLAGKIAPRINLDKYLRSMESPGVWSRKTKEIVRKAYPGWDLTRFVVPVETDLFHFFTFYSVPGEDGAPEQEYVSAPVFGGTIRDGDTIVSRAWYLMDHVDNEGDTPKQVLVQFAFPDAESFSSLPILDDSPCIAWYASGNVDTSPVESPFANIPAIRKTFRKEPNE